MSYNPNDPKPRHCTMEDVTISNDARTAAALYWLAAWFDFEPDSLWHELVNATGYCEPQGNVNDDLLDEILDELRQDYRNHPDACVSWLLAAVADKRKKTK